MHKIYAFITVYNTQIIDDIVLYCSVTIDNKYSRYDTLYICRYVCKILPEKLDTNKP